MIFVDQGTISKKLTRYPRERWAGDGGYRQLSALAIPLVLGTGAVAIQHFIDRMFLAWYSPEALAAAMPAGIVHYTVMGLFMGMATYVGTFVAQYHGAGRPERIGPSIWQGMYVSALAWIVHLLLIPFAPKFFATVGHAPDVMVLETQYFQILCLGAGPMVAGGTLGGFFSGRGRAGPVMWISFLTSIINIGLNYALIFGKFGAPEWGMAGAAWATVISSGIGVSVYIGLLMRPEFRKKFNTLSGWRLDPELFYRVFKFGGPSGVQFFLEHLGFTLFILLVGRLGLIELAATNIAFNVNMLAFMPMMGFGMALSILVGQNLGRDRPDLASRSVYSGLQLTFVYMAGIALLYIFAPGIFLLPFESQADPATFAPIAEKTTILLKFVAVYLIFDTLSINFAAGIKGAGDTKFVMYMITALSIFALALPTYLALVVFHKGLYTAWVIATTHISLMGVAFWLRFLTGKWKSMRVIESSAQID